MTSPRHPPQVLANAWNPELDLWKYRTREWLPCSGGLEHSDAAVMQMIEAVSGALAIYARALESGIDRFLVGRPSQVVFCSHNRGDERPELAAEAAEIVT